MQLRGLLMTDDSCKCAALKEGLLAAQDCYSLGWRQALSVVALPWHGDCGELRPCLSGARVGIVV